MTTSNREHGHIEPRASRPYMPGYGILDANSGRGLLPWSWATERLAKAHIYWVATTRPGGRPHVMPVWGIWLEGAFYFSTGRLSRKGRNLADNPHCVVSTEAAGEAIIVEGVAEEITDPAPIRQFAETYGAKYHYDMTGFAEPVYAVWPEVAFAFLSGTNEFTGSATRWKFDN